MKYCDKFYELTKDIKRILSEAGRKVLLVGEHESPFGTIPAYVRYDGELVEKVSTQMEAVNLMLFSKWDINDDECCIIGPSVLMDDGDGITWER